MSTSKQRGRALVALSMAAGLVACSDTDAPVPEHRPGVAAYERPDTPGSTLLFRFAPGDVVEYFDSDEGNFRIHFTRDGINAVSPADVDPVSGVPDFVEEVAGVYEEVLAHYLSMGFRAPLADDGVTDNGGDGKFDVYLVDFAEQGDGNFQRDECETANPDRCIGFMTQENDFTNYGYASTEIANRTLGSHEFFHAVQAAYDAEQGSVLAEGTATWATENLYPDLEDLDHQVRGYLENPHRSLDSPMPGPVDPFSYGAAIFFQFLDERFDTSLIRIIYERCENGANGVADPQWFEEIDGILQDEASTTFAEAFAEFAIWNLSTGTFADSTRSYADAGEWASVDMQDVLAPGELENLSVHYSSTRYYRVDPDDRDELRAALVVAPGEEAQLEGLQMVLAAEGDAGYTEILQVSDATAGTESVDLSNANFMVVAITNVLQSGDAKDPWLCVGTSAEVQSCRTSIVGQGGTGGTGGTGATGGAGGAGGLGDPGHDEPDDDLGCGCRTAAPDAGGHGSTAFWALALSLLTLAGRRRDRRGR